MLRVISLFINFVAFSVNSQITLIKFYGLVVVSSWFEYIPHGNFVTITVRKLAGTTR